MRSIKRIEPFMNWITKQWQKNPDQRFGQMLINLGLVEDSIVTWNCGIDSYDFSHEAKREIYTWGTFNKDYESEREDKFIKDLDTDHIKAILETQTHIKDTDIEQILKDELQFRSNNER